MFWMSALCVNGTSTAHATEWVENPRQPLVSTSGCFGFLWSVLDRAATANPGVLCRLSYQQVTRRPRWTK